MEPLFALANLDIGRWQHAFPADGTHRVGLIGHGQNFLRLLDFGPIRATSRRG
jgi:hypothetical protein